MNDQSLAPTVEQAGLAGVRWDRYLDLCKPKVVLLIVFTAVVGMLLAAPSPFPWGLLVAASLGIGLASASGPGCALELLDGRVER